MGLSLGLYKIIDRYMLFLKYSSSCSMAWVNLSLNLEEQMPKCCLGSIISRLQFWLRLHFHTNDSGGLGLAWHAWTDCNITG